jgi:signal transduction histidine kinase
VNRWRPIALAAVVAASGAGGTILAGAAAGMGAGEVAHLAALMLPAVGATLVAVWAARPLLRRATFRQRLMSVALVAVVASLANLAVLAGLMFVSAHDATLMAALVVYSVGAGAGVALVLARDTTSAVDRLTHSALELAEGNLDARVGPIDGGPELQALGSALDETATRLQASIAAERAGEAKRRDLITAVSHDLRTPLAGLRAMVEAIDDGVVDDPPSLRRYVGEMRRQVQSLVVLVDDLFELVQLDAGAIEAESERARLADVVGSAVAACGAQAAEKRLVVEQRLNSAGETLCSPRLVRVLQNLLQNAIRHTPADGTVRIEARPEAGGVEVVVEDGGEGIPPESADLVFEPFWRGEAARTSPGSGLGLALAKRIVETLGGAISVRSDSTTGARFAVLLPGRAASPQ